jgi:hypothetical protein
MHKTDKFIRDCSSTDSDVLVLSIPSHLVERAHVDAYSILKVPHATCDCMMTASRYEWNTFSARVLDGLDHIVFAARVDNDKVRWTLILSEPQISLIE